MGRASRGKRFHVTGHERKAEEHRPHLPTRRTRTPRVISRILARTASGLVIKVPWRSSMVRIPKQATRTVRFKDGHIVG